MRVRLWAAAHPPSLTLVSHPYNQPPLGDQPAASASVGVARFHGRALNSKKRPAASPRWGQRLLPRHYWEIQKRQPRADRPKDAPAFGLGHGTSPQPGSERAPAVTAARRARRGGRQQQQQQEQRQVHLRSGQAVARVCFSHEQRAASSRPPPGSVLPAGASVRRAGVCDGWCWA
jgi:hypothetical protein